MDDIGNLIGNSLRAANMRVPVDATVPDKCVSLHIPNGLRSCRIYSGEVIHISSLALLKMLKHGRAGVPMEVMGLMLGEFIDEYTVQVIDVFAMPQSGTTVTVESVDHVFQQKMVDMLKQTGRPEMVVGWYHSHPGFGCWLSSVDINTQQSFEQMQNRCVAVVVDPIQSVKGKVVIDAFVSLTLKPYWLDGSHDKQHRTLDTSTSHPSRHSCMD
ncbi:JAB1/Mov34/MPN/PAD-1 ubiquitin protease-domain-containing protein [Chiua virens]|nr:JAB1/Mov34/MPN/PAD-1 ubiquitin protease-domain-containing protein [Chiua virens]